MKLNINMYLKSNILNELSSYLTEDGSGIEEIKQKLYEDDLYLCEGIINTIMYSERNIVINIKLTNKQSNCNESKILYLTEDDDLLKVKYLTLLKVDISLRLDLADRDENLSYSMYKNLNQIVKDDFNVLFDLFNHNSFNEEVYFMEIMSLLLYNLELYSTKATEEQKSFIKEKLMYFGYDAESIEELESIKSINELEQLTYLVLNEVYNGIHEDYKKLKWHSDSLFRNYLSNYDKPSAIMSCRTRISS